MKKAAILLIVALLAIPLLFMVGCGSNADIHEAAESGDWDTVIRLLDRGEAVDKKGSSFGRTPLDMAVQGYGLYLAKKDTPIGDSENIKQKQACKDIAIMLIRKGADVVAANDAGVTPLYRAASIQDLELFEILFSAPGADVNVRTRKGETLLHNAAIWDNVEIVEFLLNNGADVNARNEDGETPLAIVEALVAEWGEEGDEATVIRILSEAGGTR